MAVRDSRFSFSVFTFLSSFFGMIIILYSLFICNLFIFIYQFNIKPLI